MADLTSNFTSSTALEAAAAIARGGTWSFGLSSIRFSQGGAVLLFAGSFHGESDGAGGVLLGSVTGTVSSLRLAYGGSTLTITGPGAPFEELAAAGSFSEVLALTLSGYDSVTGTRANDWLAGYGGDDTLIGGAGVDTLVGGDGFDTYVLDVPGDVVVEAEDGGLDVVRLVFTESARYTLPPNVEGAFLDIAPGVDVVLTGNGRGNTLHGSSHADTLDGGIGFGADAFFGGVGDDTYVVDTMEDRIFELDSEGFDTIVATSNRFTMPDNVEVMRFIGIGDFMGEASARMSVIHGGLGNDGLSGWKGNDVLDGGAGSDHLYGWAGCDFLVGGTGEDWLTGGAGWDTLAGGAGNDTLVGGDGFIWPNPGDGDADRFVLNSLSGTDTITDFEPGLDKIAIHKRVFTAITGTPSETPTDLAGLGGAVAYDPSTGALTYDADGAGGSDAIVIAQFTPGLALARDFLIVG